MPYSPDWEKLREEFSAFIGSKPYLLNLEYPEDCAQITDFFTSKLQAREEWLRQSIEEKFGKQGTHSGSFGYQGIVMDVQSFQTETDRTRDYILSLLTTKN